MTDSTYMRYMNKKGNVDCVKCGVALNVGTRYVSRYRKRVENCSVIYCLPCAEILNII